MGGAIFRSLTGRASGLGFPVPSFDLSFRALMVLAIVLAYYPSLKHPPRADHWCYLNDMMDHHGVIDAIESSYSYTRTRQTLPGDCDLFRPVLFALLAVERALFEGDLPSIQLIGIALHSGNCLLLLTLLRRIEFIVQSSRNRAANGTSEPYSPGFLPYAMTGFFALSAAIVEMVIWSHLHGYLLFVSLLLGSAILLLRHVSGTRAGEFTCWNLWGAWWLAFASAFTYELGQLYAALAGMFLAAFVRPRKGVVRAAALLFAFVGVMLAYQAINKHDYRLHRGQYAPDNHLIAIKHEIYKVPTLTHTVRFALYTTVQPFCPSILYTWMSGDRVNVGEALWYEPLSKRCGVLEAGFGCELAVIIAFAFAGFWGLMQRGNRLPRLILGLLVATGSAYAAMNILGRMNLRPGRDCLCSNSYYTYTGLLFGVMVCFTLLQGVARLKSVAAAAAWKIMLVGLVALTIYGGIKVRLVNKRLANMMLEMSAPIRAVHKFVKQHRHEPDFSMAIEYKTSDPVPGRYGKHVTDMIFRRWIAANAKYRIAIRHRAAVVVAAPALNTARN